MTRFNHMVLFFFAIALALLCSSVLMLYFDSAWNDATFTTLITTALIGALLLPSAGAIASLKLLKWRQPLTAWLVFYGLVIIIAAAFGQSLL